MKTTSKNTWNNCLEQQNADQYQLMEAALKALDTLSERQVELAVVVSTTLESINQLLTRGADISRREKLTICLTGLRTLRATKSRLAENDRPESSIFDDATHFLLMRVVDDLDRLIGCILKMDLKNPIKRENIEGTIKNATLSVLAAEHYSSLDRIG